jgi:hypothetical protein
MTVSVGTTVPVGATVEVGGRGMVGMAVGGGGVAAGAQALINKVTNNKAFNKRPGLNDIFISILLF